MSKLHKSALLCMLALRCYVPVSAQPVKSITLPELLKVVSFNAPKLLSDSAAVIIQQNRVDQAKFNWLPAANLNYQANLGTNNNLPGGYFSYGIVPSNSRVRDQGSASTILTDLGIASFQWEAYNFGANKAERSVASAALATERAKFTQSRYELQATVVNDYLQLLQISKLIEIQQLNIDRNQEIRKSIQSLAKNGIIAGVDTSIAEAELSKSRLNYIELENQYRQVALRLATTSGLQSEMILPDTTMLAKIILAAPALALSAPDSVNHPLLGIYKSLYDQDRQEEQLIRKQFLPKLFLSAAIWGRGSSITGTDEFKSLGSGLGFNRGNYLAGFGVSYDLFNNKRKKLALGIKEAEISYSSTKIREQDALLKLGFRQANAEVEIARRRFEEIPNQLKAASAAYRQKLSLYRNGLNDIVELNAALYILYRAETDYIIAENSLCKAIFQKAFMENTLNRVLAIIQ
ncbi:MAG: TolC family protein [Chitinophagaceae bacterium]|nr:MAG: TolC family protein [Chitinophagaceae bacterium]